MSYWATQWPWERLTCLLWSTRPHPILYPHHPSLSNHLPFKLQAGISTPPHLAFHFRPCKVATSFPYPPPSSTFPAPSTHVGKTTAGAPDITPSQHPTTQEKTPLLVRSSKSSDPQSPPLAPIGWCPLSCIHSWAQRRQADWVIPNRANL